MYKFRDTTLKYYYDHRKCQFVQPHQTKIRKWLKTNIKFWLHLQSYDSVQEANNVSHIGIGVVIILATVLFSPLTGGSGWSYSTN
jgi:hypothetical protein